MFKHTTLKEFSSEHLHAHHLNASIDVIEEGLTGETGETILTQGEGGGRRFHGTSPLLAHSPTNMKHPTCARLVLSTRNQMRLAHSFD